MKIKQTDDTVNVVLCKDCKYHEDEKPGMIYCSQIAGGWVEEDCFCAIWEKNSRCIWGGLQ